MLSAVLEKRIQLRAVPALLIRTSQGFLLVADIAGWGVADAFGEVGMEDGGCDLLVLGIGEGDVVRVEDGDQFAEEGQPEASKLFDGDEVDLRGDAGGKEGEDAGPVEAVAVAAA